MARNYKKAAPKKSEEQVKKELPKKGRRTDTVLGHLTNGEMVIPVEILDADKGYLREVINGVMKELGGNPNEYTVGHKDNKINPETGYPEFWGWNPFKAVKKVVKSVVNTVKKVVKTAAAAVGLAAPDYKASEGASTGQQSYSNTTRAQEEAGDDASRKSALLRRRARGKRRLRIQSGETVGNSGTGSGVNAGSGSGTINVPKG